MKKYIECRDCDSKSCAGCNIFILSNMLRAGKFDEIMDGNRKIKSAADVVERKRGEWVSVEERLPDIELVEAKAKDLDYFPCLAVIKSTVSVLGRYVGKLWYGEEGFIDQDVCPMDNVVTHWMPLPEPPNCGADMREG